MATQARWLPSGDTRWSQLDAAFAKNTFSGKSGGSSAARPMAGSARTPANDQQPGNEPPRGHPLGDTGDDFCLSHAIRPRLIARNIASCARAVP